MTVTTICPECGSTTHTLATCPTHLGLDARVRSGELGAATAVALTRCTLHTHNTEA
jgi:hypothetical protein